MRMHLELFFLSGLRSSLTTLSAITRKLAVRVDSGIFVTLRVCTCLPWALPQFDDRPSREGCLGESGAK